MNSIPNLVLIPGIIRCYAQTSNLNNPRIVCANLGFDLCAHNPKFAQDNPRIIRICVHNTPECGLVSTFCLVINFLAVIIVVEI